MKIRVPDLPSPPAPNVTALMDILILLLVFFMMWGSFGQRECETIRLPQVDSLKTDCGSGRYPHLVMNAYHRTDRTCRSYLRREGCRLEEHWRLDIKGQDCTDPGDLDRVLANEALAHDDLRVLLRADEAAPFGLVQRAVHGCSLHGLHRIKTTASLFPEPFAPAPVQRARRAAPAPSASGWFERVLWSNKEAEP